MAPDHKPHVLMPVAIEDDTVPPPTGKALARAFAIPHLTPILESVDGMNEQETPARVNHLDESVTAGFFQFDRVTQNGMVVPATHSNLPLSEEGFLQTLIFLETWREEMTPTIIDPYENRGTGTLPVLSE